MAVPSLDCLRVLRCILGRRSAPTCQSKVRHYASATPQRKSPQPEEDDLVEPTREARAAGPRPLDHPLGTLYPPLPGENTGVDLRTLRQRRDDFVDHEKHIGRRKQLAKTLFRPYFKDFTDMNYHRGKTFLAPTRLFKSQFARYFPNLRGKTLEGFDGDTTDVLKGKISVVTLEQTDWAKNQVQSFVGDFQNPALLALMDHGDQVGGEKAQLVEISHEQNWLKNWIYRFTASRLRAARSEFRWGRYFVVTKGFDQELQRAIGMWNQKVGHVYLVDGKCKIRWAGHADAQDWEKTAMVSCLKRLLAEAKEPLPARPAKEAGEKLIASAGNAASATA